MHTRCHRPYEKPHIAHTIFIKIYKMKKFLPAAICAASLLLTSCNAGDSFFADDSSYRKTVMKDYSHRVELLGGYDATGIVDDPSVTPREKEMLQFLYAYMPMGDMINYDGEYFLENVRLSEQARQTFSWGKEIPEMVYRHFVVPIRVNNEDIDGSRAVFFKELAPRVKDLSMKDAILEVNHWCHEKVVYTPTDSRTRGPLSLVCGAAGRCGEESTFLVSALRSVGIPARQVYTPRWAHTDDNHAWVEAWADGQWHFLGACEPEPVLDLGWFNSSASRGMLLHTNVFGRYNGPEQVMSRTELFTEINITSNYAPTASVEVQAVDTEGAPVPGALVEFKVYNYSEFYSIAKKTAGQDGKVSVTAGCGDALVWASDPETGRYGFHVASFGKDSSLKIVLSHKAGDNFRSEVSIIPPKESGKLPEVTEEQRAENTRRMVQEDSIRNAYVATFCTPEDGKAFAAANGLDKERTARLLVESKGNHEAIKAFLSEAVSKGQADRALDLLESIRPKDLGDTPVSVLDDHLYNSTGTDPRVISPRVRMELLSAYREYLQKNIPEDLAASFKQDPQNLVSWCRENLAMADDYCMRLVPTRPEGTWKSRVSDGYSRDLFFVAACRSLEIPAWVDEVSGKVRYFHQGKEFDVDFEAPEPQPNDYGTVVLGYTPTKDVKDPRYSIHFTISRIEDGRLVLMNFDEGGTVDELLTTGARLDSGDYDLVIGTRLDWGEVLSEISFFTVPEDGKVKVELLIPEKVDTSRILGTADLSAQYYDADGQAKTLKDFIGSDKCVVAVLGAGEEPTNHILNDISVFKKDMEKSGAKMLMVFADGENAKRFRAADFPDLPENIVFGTDKDGSVKEALLKGAGSDKEALPVVSIIDGFGNITFLTSGYIIGTGERLLRDFRE